MPLGGKIIVAGCGRMGLPMARALRAAGFDARGFDVKPREAFGDFAPHMVDAETMRAEAETLITVVRDAAETDALLFDVQRAATGPALKTLIVSSTLSPKYLSTIRDRAPDRLTFIDAPMSGAQIAAEERRLSFMLGGDKAALDALQPLFDAMGTKHHRMGPFGAGMAGKVLNNYVAGAAAAGVRRALDWAPEMGLDRDRLLAMIHDSSGQTWFGSNFNKIEFARDGYAPDNTVHILQKDVAAALDGADAPDDALGTAVIGELRGWKPLE
ncbi:MAG: NAD(P)-binding domain-containing protein [Pseudomonadota bacterium]